MPPNFAPVTQGRAQPETCVPDPPDTNQREFDYGFFSVLVRREPGGSPVFR